MSAPSKWPLPDAGVRFVTPGFMTAELAEHPLTRGCYPTAMGYYPRAVGHLMEREGHDDNLLIYCTEGKGRLTTEECDRGVQAGEIMLLPQGLWHRYQADSVEPWTLFWVHFPGQAARAFLEFLGFRDGNPVVSVGVSPVLQGAFSSLMAVRRTGYSTRAFIKAANQLRHVLSEFALEASTHPGRDGGALDLSRVQAFMREHLDQNLTLDELAASANMSKYHFSTRYRQLSGYSPVRHFLNMKMEHACSLLDRTNLSVSAIALRLGYEDPLYFSRIFRKTIGRSPRAYRASIRQD